MNFVSFVFSTLGTRLPISKFSVDLCKKNLDRTRCLAVSILSTISDPKLLGPRYNINWNSKSAERAKAFWFLKEERNTCIVVIHRKFETSEQETRLIE